MKIDWELIHDLILILALGIVASLVILSVLLGVLGNVSITVDYENYQTKMETCLALEYFTRDECLYIITR